MLCCGRVQCGIVPLASCLAGRGFIFPTQAWADGCSVDHAVPLRWGAAASACDAQFYPVLSHVALCGCYCYCGGQVDILCFTAAVMWQLAGDACRLQELVGVSGCCLHTLALAWVGLAGTDRFWPAIACWAHPCLLYDVLVQFIQIIIIECMPIIWAHFRAHSKTLVHAQDGHKEPSASAPLLPTIAATTTTTTLQRCFSIEFFYLR